MELSLPFLLDLVVIIVAAKAAGYLSNRLGQPAVLGELLIGLILGPTLLDMPHWAIFNKEHLEGTISLMAVVGVLFLMFIAGVEVDMETMLRSGRISLLAGITGVVVPVLMGLLIAWLFGMGAQSGLFIGLVLAATSVSISAQTLMELGVLRTRVGMALLGAAVVDDVLVILLLSLFVAVVGGEGGGLAVLWVIVRMVLFLAVGLVVGARYIPRLTALVSRLPISEGVMSLVIVTTLFYSWAAEALGGVASITGAFLAGILFSRTPLRRSIEAGMHTIAYSWLVPIFFVSIGLQTNLRTLGLVGIPLALAILVVALLSKVIGCGAGARVGGCTPAEALRVGVGMTSRGEVGLIVATVGLAAGLVDEAIFASIVLMVLVTSLATPIALRALYPKPQASAAKTESAEVKGP